MGLPRRRAWGWGNRWFPIPPIAQSWPANTNNFSRNSSYKFINCRSVVLHGPWEMLRRDDIMIVELSIFHHGIHLGDHIQSNVADYCQQILRFHRSPAEVALSAR
ncbi:hypothetical protein Patl1_19342 [Pistacia atlantica]|uniref:Uncharacterized protein n=1 Tax=Pistacia atlantica TaxID=434234 RepID=A0ACC1C3W3_9ROSI|nr:hypothetical protein Patl1_19342 [Pistacia atlantica]